MTFFNPTEPLLRSKQEAMDLQDLEGLWRFQWKIGEYSLFSGHYTRIDQVFVVWGAIAAVIFLTAQFFPISWGTQAIFWSTLTLVGTVSMVALTRYWAKVEHLTWLIYFWVILMLGGLAITDLSIFWGIGEILIRLCPLWLGLSAVGYLGTGVGMRSRTFLICSIVHLLGIAILPYVGGWQFLTTAAVMAGSLLFLAELQWDMRPPIDSRYLTAEQKEFNRQQERRRQLSVAKNV